MASAALELDTLVYPTASPLEQTFPEQAIARYRAASGMWGVSFSGGGPRSFAASLGQMRGLNAAGVLPLIGAISCVSGGSWLGGLFSFAPESYSDDDLLGPVVPPGNLTVSGINYIDQRCLGSALLNLGDARLAELVAYYLFEWKYYGFPFDKIWSRVINDTLLSRFALDSTSTLVTLDADTLAAIRRRNPSLTNQFLTLRSAHPFFIAGGTQVYPLGTSSPTAARAAHPSQVRATRVAPLDRSVQNEAAAFFRQFEYTPGYVGTPQEFARQGIGGADIGYGYVESFAFDTSTPSVQSSSSAKVPQGKYPFLLSDMVGSSSAALAAYFDEFGYSGGFPYFEYWPIRNIGREPAALYSFGDGGILENTGIVPLLRRGYRTIFAFVNTPFPVNSDDPGCVEGVDGQISRLFGFIPKDNYGSTQNTQIFDGSQYADLVARLKATRSVGGPVFCADYYPVLPSNPFDIPPYRPLIFWLYNDWNIAWHNALPASIQSLFTTSTPSDYLGNFPNYATVFQNHDEVLYLSPRQINLLADMWCYTVVQGFTSKAAPFGVDLA